MAKGGKRRGTGRKKGSKDSKPRTKKKMLPAVVEEAKKELATTTDSKALYNTIKKFLSAANRKQYKVLLKEYETPADCLKAIRDDLMVRYKTSRIREIEDATAEREAAEKGLKEIEEKGTLDGKKLTPYTKSRRKKKFKELISKPDYPKLSSQVTALASELRQINELIDRIESGRPDRTFNIFNILEGKADKEKTRRLEKEIFTFPDELKNAEDAEFEEEE
jgi:hypothetical protein